MCDAALQKAVLEKRNLLGLLSNGYGVVGLHFEKIKTIKVINPPGKKGFG